MEKKKLPKKAEKKMFFGWTNIKWVLKEIMLIYSSKPSFFSKKRIESGVAFAIAQLGMVFFLIVKYPDLGMWDFILWASAEFAVAGYIINKIQKEKYPYSEEDADIPSESEEDTESPN